MRIDVNQGFEAEIAAQPEFQAGKVRIAEEVVKEAQTIAPKHTLHYVDSLGWVTEEGGVYVRTTDPAGHMVEFGSVNNHPYAPIRRAVLAVGLRLAEIPKPS